MRKVKHSSKKYKYVAFACLLFLGLGCAESQAASTTSGKIKFSENDNVVEPVLPDDPEVPLKPSHPLEKGPLSISYATKIVFGSQKIEDVDKSYFANLAKVETLDGKEVEIPNFVQLTNNHGASTGWKLLVALKQPLVNEKGFELKNIVFTLDNIVAKSQDEMKDSIQTSSKVELSKVGESQLVAEAKPGTGLGTWDIMFGKDAEDGKEGVSIFIPGKTEKEEGAYKTSLTWTLAQTK